MNHHGSISRSFISLRGGLYQPIEKESNIDLKIPANLRQNGVFVIIYINLQSSSTRAIQQKTCTLCVTSGFCSLNVQLVPVFLKVPLIGYWLPFSRTRQDIWYRCFDRPPVDDVVTVQVLCTTT